MISVRLAVLCELSAFSVRQSFQSPARRSLRPLPGALSLA